MAIHFISDLHLHDEASWLGELFTRMLADWRGKIDALYILGDLFEAWVGDDDDSPFHAAMLAAMRDFSAVTPLYVLRGNRDFLLGHDFLARHRVRELASDPTVLTFGQQRYLLSHGDLLCTDDVAYQQFRAQVRSPQWQQAFLARPLAERQAIARQMREHSEARHAATAPADYAHTNAELARQWLQAADAPMLIHGHTHQPADHALGTGADGHALTQVVLSDWHITATERRLEVLRLSAQGGLQRVSPGPT